MYISHVYKLNNLTKKFMSKNRNDFELAFLSFKYQFKKLTQYSHFNRSKNTIPSCYSTIFQTYKHVNVRIANCLSTLSGQLPKDVCPRKSRISRVFVA